MASTLLVEDVDLGEKLVIEVVSRDDLTGATITGYILVNGSQTPANGQGGLDNVRPDGRILSGYVSFGESLINTAGPFTGVVTVALPGAIWSPKKFRFHGTIV